jgi:hypothetical protein
MKLIGPLISLANSSAVREKTERLHTATAITICASRTNRRNPETTSQKNVSAILTFLQNSGERDGEMNFLQ